VALSDVALVSSVWKIALDMSEEMEDGIGKTWHKPNDRTISRTTNRMTWRDVEVRGGGSMGGLTRSGLIRLS
jgi:hypothetical protein